MKKFCFALLCCFLAFTARAQQIGTWQVYPSYWQATSNLTVGKMVYTLCNGNLMAYDTEDTSVHTFDCLNDLNDIHISYLGYSTEAKRLILVYDNGNIDLMNADGSMTNLSALKDKTLSGKEVNSLTVQGSTAYLCTGFGFIEIDLKEAVFIDTYQLGHRVNSLGVAQDGGIYLATPEGIFCCPAEKNRKQIENWTCVDQSKCEQLLAFKDMLVGRRGWNVFTLQNGKQRTLHTGRYDFMRLCGDELLWGNNEKICLTTDGKNVNEISQSNEWLDVQKAGNLYWACEGTNGLHGYKFSNGAFVPDEGPIQPNSPKNDLCYRASWMGDRLLVTGGINTTDAIYLPPTAMYYEDGEWTNFQEMDIPSDYPNFSHCNTTNLVQDPLDDTHHFASLYRSGLCEYRNAKQVKFYNCDNSPLRSILPDNAKYYNFVSCTGLQFDTDHNLWMLCSETDTVIRVRKDDGKWAALYYSDFKGAKLCDDYLMHSSGLFFVVSRIMEKRGFYCFDTHGTLNSTRDDKHILRSTITNQDGTSYSPDEFYCLTEDLDGRIWCGTSLGVFVINDATEYFDSGFRFEQVKIARNDGSGLADYLLNGVSVNCIAIDGANRKWVGTHTNGLYLLSADGTEMLEHFTTDNSPLLSNMVQTIAVHPSTGTVMVGTDKGLCSYVGDATEGAEELQADSVVAFPNPVRPDYNGQIAIRGLVMDSEVKILSATGQLVWSGTSSGGTALWNGCNQRGRRVASGVYHVVANNAEGKKAVVTRIVFIR